jgi:hypothetical protein
MSQRNTLSQLVHDGREEELFRDHTATANFENSSLAETTREPRRRNSSVIEPGSLLARAIAGLK